MDKWTSDFWIANENECKKTLMEPGSWEKVIHFVKFKEPQKCINYYINDLIDFHIIICKNIVGTYVV